MHVCVVHVDVNVYKPIVCYPHSQVKHYQCKCYQLLNTNGWQRNLEAIINKKNALRCWQIIKQIILVTNYLLTSFANLIPRAHFSFCQHHEYRLWHSPIWKFVILRLLVVSAQSWLADNKKMSTLRMLRKNHIRIGQLRPTEKWTLKTRMYM